MNCCFVPMAMLGLVGVTAIDTNTAAVTVRVVAPETPSMAAVMVVLPTPAEVTRPSLPAVPDTVAAEAFVEVQVTRVVRSCLVLSE